MNKSLADFAQNPLEYDISEMMGEDEICLLYTSLEAHFTEKLIGNMAVDVLDIGTVHFPTGEIFACDPLVELEDTLPFLQRCV